MYKFMGGLVVGSALAALGATVLISVAAFSVEEAKLPDYVDGSTYRFALEATPEQRVEAAQALTAYKWEILEARTGLWRLAIGKLPDGTKLVLGCDKEQPTWGVIRPLTTSYDDSEPEVRNPTVPAGGKLKMPPPAPRLLAK